MLYIYLNHQSLLQHLKYPFDIPSLLRLEIYLKHLQLTPSNHFVHKPQYCQHLKNLTDHFHNLFYVNPLINQEYRIIQALYLFHVKTHPYLLPIVFSLQFFHVLSLLIIAKPHHHQRQSCQVMLPFHLTYYYQY